MNQEYLDGERHYYEMQIIEGEQWVKYCKEKLAKLELEDIVFNVAELELELEFND